MTYPSIIDGTDERCKLPIECLCHFNRPNAASLTKCDNDRTVSHSSINVLLCALVTCHRWIDSHTRPDLSHHAFPSSFPLIAILILILIPFLILIFILIPFLHCWYCSGRVEWCMCGSSSMGWVGCMEKVEGEMG